MKTAYKTLEVRFAASIQWQLAGRLSLQDEAIGRTQIWQFLLRQCQ